MKIAIIGQQCSGKSTAAGFFMEKFNKSYVIKVADPIYDTLKVLNQKKNRGFMQEFADLAKKYFGKLVLVQLFERKIKKYSNISNNELVICDDIRYQYELDMVKKYKFNIISIDTNIDVRKARAKKQGYDFIEKHNSEIEVPSLIPQADIIIIDNGLSVDDLRKKCFDILTDCENT